MQAIGCTEGQDEYERRTLNGLCEERVSCNAVWDKCRLQIGQSFYKLNLKK